MEYGRVRRDGPLLPPHGGTGRATRRCRPRSARTPEGQGQRQGHPRRLPDGPDRRRRGRPQVLRPGPRPAPAMAGTRAVQRRWRSVAWPICSVPSPAPVCNWATRPRLATCYREEVALRDQLSPAVADQVEVRRERAGLERQARRPERLPRRPEGRPRAIPAGASSSARKSPSRTPTRPRPSATCSCRSRSSAPTS